MKITQEIDYKFQIGENLKAVSKWSSELNCFVILSDYNSYEFETTPTQHKPLTLDKAVIGMNLDVVEKVCKDFGYKICTGSLKTANLDFKRLNIHLEDNKVVSADIG